MDARPGRIRRLIELARRHKALAGSAAVVLTALGIFVLLWFQPWKLFVDETVDEAAPELVSTPGPSASPGESVKTLSVGEFRDLEHDTKGRARILELPDGSRIVRLEDGFETSNGPDLVVMLSDTPATEDKWGAYDDGRVVNLGKLKGNKGNQNYTIPSNVDLGSFRSVVVWCRRFTVGFGAAPLTLA